MRFHSIYDRYVTRQFIRFCLVGLESTILTYLLFTILYYFFTTNYLLASAIGFLAGVFLGFIFNKLYTFESNKKSIMTLPQYFMIYLFSLGLNLISIKILVESFFLAPLLAMILVNPAILVVNFFGTKIIVFKNKRW